MVARIILHPHTLDILASVETAAQTAHYITLLHIVTKEKETTRALEEAPKEEEILEELTKLLKE